MRHERQTRDDAAIAFAERLAAGRVEQTRFDDDVIGIRLRVLLRPHLHLQREVGADLLREIRGCGNVRRNRGDGEHAGRGDVAREHAEERCVHELLRDRGGVRIRGGRRELGEGDGDLQHLRRLRRIDGGDDLRLRGERCCGKYESDCDE